VTADKLRKHRDRLQDRPFGYRLLLLMAVTLLFALIIHPNLLVTRLPYGLGDVAEKDVKAQRDFLVEDQTATEIKRQQAVQDVLTVFDIDTELAGRLSRTVEEAFSDMRALRRTALEPRTPPPAPESAAAGADKKPDAGLQADDIRKSFEDRLGIRVSRGAFAALETEGFSKRVADAIGEILQKITENGVVSTREALLKDFEKGVLLRDVHSREERVVRDFKQF